MKRFKSIRKLLILASTMLIVSCNNPESDFKRAEQSNTEQAYLEFIKNHSDSPLVTQAKARIETMSFQEAQKAATTAAFEAFLQRFQLGELAQHAKRELEALEFAQAKKATTIPIWEGFLQKYPQSTNSPRAKQELANLVLQRVTTTNTVSAYEDFAKQFSDTEAAKEAMKRVELLEYQVATNADDMAALEGFLRRYPKSDVANKIQNRIKSHLEERDWNSALLANTPEAYSTFQNAHPDNNRVKVYSGTIRMQVIAEGVPALEQKVKLSLNAFSTVVSMGEAFRLGLFEPQFAINFSSTKVGPGGEIIMESEEWSLPNRRLVLMNEHNAYTIKVIETLKQ